MCYIWKNPTDQKEKCPWRRSRSCPGLRQPERVGGEPTLRRDLSEIVDLLYPKARILEISSNGLHREAGPHHQEVPKIKVRFSVEGDEATSNAIRGEKDGYATKMAGMRALQEAGGRSGLRPSSSRMRMSTNSCACMRWPARWAWSCRPPRCTTPGILQERQLLLRPQGRGPQGGGFDHLPVEQQQAEELVPRPT